MKINNIIILISFALVAVGCQKSTKSNVNESVVYQCPMKCEDDKTYDKETVCPICNMDLKVLVEKKKLESDSSDKISETSIFNLTSKWNTEEGKMIELKELKGKTLVMVMIYTTCKAACPRLVADMRNIEAQIPDEFIPKINFVMVSIDPETDTPKRLKEFAIENFMDDAQWTFLQGTEATVREFANVLAVKYKQISPMDFSHSNIISVFNSEGELMYQQEGLGVDNKETIKTIIELQH